MPDEWLTLEEAATRLSCSTGTVRAMLRDRLLFGQKVEGRWQVKASEIERLRTIAIPTKQPQPSVRVEPGMVEVSIALAGIAAAIAAILPGISGAPETFSLFIAALAGVLAVFSAYSALWLLACYCIGDESTLGFREILVLLTNPTRARPYWFVALALLIWLILSLLIGVLAVIG